MPFIKKILIHMPCKKIKQLKTVKIVSAKAAGFKTLKIAESAAKTI